MLARKEVPADQREEKLPGLCSSLSLHWHLFSVSFIVVLPKRLELHLQQVQVQEEELDLFGYPVCGNRDYVMREVGGSPWRMLQRQQVAS